MMRTLKNDIVVMGDIHGDFGTLNAFINKRKPKMILQVGDFGYFPHIKPLKKEKYKKDPTIKAQNTIIHWCDGNHEDHWSLKDRTTDELWPNTFYQPRGSVITLEDGRNVMFFGGAESIDKSNRTLGHDWFPEEVITQSDFNNLPDVKIDIMITHTCPNEFDLTTEGDRWREYKQKDPSKAALSYLLEEYSPKHWYFGHYHFNRSGEYNGTEWDCIDMTFNHNWWMKLK
ncbi:MAG: metallophosphoesterase family protein [Desulfobulbia bacterium]